jgi:hypothetical protein
MRLSTLRWLLTYRHDGWYAPWPFLTKPPNVTVVAAEIAGRISVYKGHRTLSQSKITLSSARRFIWWLEGRDYPEHDPGLATICKVERCIAPAHLVLADSPLKYTPPPRPRPEPKVKPPHIPLRERYRAEYNDRNRCLTAKIWYPTRDIAQTVGNGVKPQKNYAYDCPACDGWHLTKKKNFRIKKIGAWV